uniref:Origin recognition complex subunit 4 n=1 Tax=Schistosoma japonicum TaxID=6182 RepID=Q5D904_SCHJA|nr:SJCHGC09022 protein [Schistosoma japonicum]
MPLRTLEDCRRCERLVKSWNNHIEKLMNDEIVIDSLRQAWSISVSIRRLMNLLIPIVASLGPEHDRIKPVQFIESLCTLQQDSKLTALKEYLKYCRSNCLGHLYEKPVVMKALDNLVDFELIVFGKGAITASNGLFTVNSKTSWNFSFVLPNYRPLFCYVDSDILTACLDTYPSCPVELKHYTFKNILVILFFFCFR